MIVNVGTRECGYTQVTSFEDQLKHYLDNVADKYEGELIEENKKFAEDILKGNSLIKYAKMIGMVTLATVALLDLATGGVYAQSAEVFAQGTDHLIIDTSPLDKLFSQVYWTMVKALMYVTTPIWAWIGYTVLLSGTSSEKRTVAKKTGIGLFCGTGIVVLAPWLTKQMMKLWNLLV